MSTPAQRRRRGLRGRVVLITGSGHGIGAELARVAGAARSARRRQLPPERQGGGGGGRRHPQGRGRGPRLPRRRHPSRGRAGPGGRGREALGTGGRARQHGGPLRLEAGGGDGVRRVAGGDRLQPGLRLPDVPARACPHMRKRHWGRIVNLGAVGAERTLGEPQVAAYSAAKAGVVALSKSLALEEARCGITVNVVSPGILQEDGARQGRGGCVRRPRARGPRRPHRGRGARRALLLLPRRRLRHRPGPGRGGRGAALAGAHFPRSAATVPSTPAGGCSCANRSSSCSSRRSRASVSLSSALTVSCPR